MLETIKKTYHHGCLAGAMKRVARDLIAAGEKPNLREVARRIGVTATSGYRHFQSVEDLFGQVAKEDLAELDAVVRAASDPAVACIEWVFANRFRFAHAVASGRTHMDAFADIFGSRWPAVYGASTLAAEGLISVEQARAAVA